MIKSNKILVIDDGEKNQSINYMHSEIDNTVEEKIDAERLITEYKVDNENIFKYNTEDCLTLVLNDGSEISLNKFKDQEIRLIKITNELLKKYDCEFYVGCNSMFYESPTTLQWQTDLKEIITDDNYKINLEKIFSVNDIDGFQNCIKIYHEIDCNPELGVCPAIRYCLDRQIKINNTTYQGFMPSSLQFKWLWQVADIINYILQNDRLDLDNGDIYTSSEFNDKMSYAKIDKKPYTLFISKQTKCRVIPIFKKIR